MQPSRMNLHNHTVFSDGTNEVSDIVEYAESVCHLDSIGITDHYYTHKVPDKSIQPSDLSKYIDHIQEVKETVDSIQLLAGLEVDFSPRTPDFEAATFPFNIVNELDFVLFEYVNSAAWSGYSFDDLFDIMDRIQVPVGIAHSNFRTDVCMENGPVDLLRKLSEAGIFLELAPGTRNCESTPNGLVPFYRVAEDMFAKIKELEIHVLFSIGTDTHSDISEVCKTSDAEDFLEELGLAHCMIML